MAKRWASESGHQKTAGQLEDEAHHGGRVRRSDGLPALRLASDATNRPPAVSAPLRALTTQYVDEANHWVVRPPGHR